MPLPSLGRKRLRPCAITMITDIHTHNTVSTDGIICTTPHSFSPLPGKFYSCGIHPWETAGTGNDDIGKLCRILARPEIAAIGETGIDRLKGAPATRQEELLRMHIALSERFRKPLIIHEVKAADIILAIHRQTKPKMPWVRHGFRGNAQTARMYWSKGIYLSVGEKFNAEAVASIPEALLLLETDESRRRVRNETLRRLEHAETCAQDRNEDDRIRNPVPRRLRERSFHRKTLEFHSPQRLRGDTLVLTVEDDGAGMTPEQLAHIYDQKESDESSSKIGYRHASSCVA